MNYSHVLHSELNYKNLLQNLNVKKCVNLERYFRNNTYSICAVLSDTKNRLILSIPRTYVLGCCVPSRWDFEVILPKKSPRKDEMR